MALDQKDEDVLFYVGGGIVLYIGLTQLLKIVGVDPADTNLINSSALLPAEQDPFNMDFEPFVTKFQSNWTSGGTTEQQFFQAAKYEYDNGAQTYDGTSNDLAIAAETIYNAFGMFSWPDSTYTKVAAAFQQLQSQAEVAWVAAYLYYNYGVSLRTFLNIGTFQMPLLPHVNNGLSDKNFAAIITQVDALPETPTTY